MRQSKKHVRPLWVLIFICSVAGCSFHRAVADSFSLTVLHTNDVHAHLLQFDKHGSTCRENDAQANQCFGGVARRQSAIAEARRKSANVLLLDAGDEFGGTLFFNRFKGVPERKFMNELRYDAMTIGNHEFDEGPGVLEQFAKGVNFPLLAANVDLHREPRLKDLIKPYVVFELGGRKVGVLGLVSEEAKSTSRPGPNVEFKDIDSSARDAVAQLQSKGVNIIIALSHAGLGRDVELAKTVPGIDIIVGGHTHSVLSNKVVPAEGPYPEVISSPAGEPVLVVTAGSYGKYLGDLEVDYNAQGVAQNWTGEARLLDASVPEQTVMLAEALEYKKELEPFYQKIIGDTEIDLAAADNVCRFTECNFGNLVTDAMLWEGQDDGVQIALMNGGSIRASIAKGDIALVQLLEAMPFDSAMATCQISGKRLKEILEHGVSCAEDPQSDGTGRFLQVAGLSFSWDASQPAGRRVKDVKIIQAGRGSTPLESSRQYKVATNSFIRQGGDDYRVFAAADIVCYDFGRPINDVLIDYFQRFSPVSPQVSGRIKRLR
jgi:5'-nucleotidase / UDP-sugar diphosphatase